MLRTYIDKRGKFGRVLASIYKQEGDGFQTRKPEHGAVRYEAGGRVSRPI